MSKVLIVDDTDPSISYSGAPWQALGTVGDTTHEFNGTIHRGDTNGQTISYTFNGTGISVYGTLDTPATKGLPKVTFKVDSIDAVQINSTGSLTYNIGGVQSHEVLYQSPNLVQGTHTLTIAMTGDAGATGPYFFFDFLTVKTGKDSVAGYVMLDDRDPAISYVPDWAHNGIPPEYQGTTSQTGATGSFATFAFNGTEIYVYGTTDSGAHTPHGACQIGFEIDGVTGPEYNCDPTGPALLHNVLFSNKDLTDGNHTLKISVENEHTWFLDYLIYKTSNSSVAASAANGGGNGGNGGNGNNNNNGNGGGGGSKSNTGAIAGGVVGGLVGLAALIFLAVWLLRKQKKTHDKMEQEAHPVMTAPGATSTNGHSFNNGFGSPPMSSISSASPGSTPFMAQNVAQPYGYAQGFGYGNGQPQGMPQPGHIQYSLIPPTKGSRQADSHTGTPSLTNSGDNRSSLVESSIGATSVYSGIQQTAVRQQMPPLSEVPQTASTMAMPVGPGHPNWVNYNTPHTNSFTSPTSTSEGFTSSGHTGAGAGSGWPNEKRPRYDGDPNSFSNQPLLPQIPPAQQPQHLVPPVHVEVDSGRRFRPTTGPAVSPISAPPVYTED